MRDAVKEGNFVNIDCDVAHSGCGRVALLGEGQRP